jgi:hypothetical protein
MQVVEDPELSSEQKIEVLLRWQYEAAEGSVAIEEGMPGRDHDLWSVADCIRKRSALYRLISEREGFVRR